MDKRKALRTRWAVAIIILLVNISGFCIWLPARLRVSSEYVTVSKVWDRSEKCVFLVIDAGLNAYFLFLVKTHLIAEGLEKYKLLYRFNSVIVIVSVAMDVCKPVYTILLRRTTDVVYPGSPSCPDGLCANYLVCSFQRSFVFVLICAKLNNL